MQSDIARALLIVGILAFTLGAAAVFRNPNLLMFSAAVLWVRKPKAARRSTQQQLNEIAARLDVIQVQTEKPPAP